MGRALATAATALLCASAVLAQTGTGTKCSASSQCPESKPCCSQYGECGVGAYCLGGCDPKSSHSLNACVPAPVCKSEKYKLNSLDAIESNRQYLGDSSKADWVSSGTPLQSPDKDAVILTLSEDGESSSGTLLASTAYVWYGKITAKLRTSRGQGVVTAFILLGDNKDEIDFEFVGTDLSTAQSNFYYQGITDYKNSKNLTVKGDDTFSDYHTYEIDWKPDQITWSVDGSLQRTLKKSETFNKTDNQYHYPQTPSRVQLSLWPAGLSKNGKGTVEWSGGPISWSQQDPSENGYYYAMYKEVDIECYEPPDNVKKNGDKSYVWTNKNALESDVSITDKETVLKSLLATGEDMDKDIPNKPSGTKSSSSEPTGEVATIPGLTGAGPGTDGTRGGGDAGSADGGSGGSQASGGSNAQSTGIGGFSQGNGGSGSSGTSDAVKVEQVVAGTMFAALMALAGGMLIL